MASYVNDDFFGQHLLNRNYITLNLLIKTLDIQKKLNKKIGDWAVELGYINKEQANEIHNEQKRTNKYFGEIAIKKGFLKAEDVDKLSVVQKEAHTYIGEIFVLLGYISEDQFKKELSEFNKNDETRLNKINQFIFDNAEKFKYLSMVIDAAEHTIFRMLLLSIKVSDRICFTDIIKKKESCFRIDFSGDINFSVYYNFNRDFCNDAVFNFFKTYPKKKVLSMREPVLQELTNIVSGVIASDLANLKDISVNISVPKSIVESELKFDKPGFQVNFISPDSELEITIILN